MSLAAGQAGSRVALNLYVHRAAPLWPWPPFSNTPPLPVPVILYLPLQWPLFSLRLLLYALCRPLHLQGFLLGPLHPCLWSSTWVLSSRPNIQLDISAWAPCRHCPKCTPNMLAFCLANGTLAPRSWGTDPGVGCAISCMVRRGSLAPSLLHPPPHAQYHLLIHSQLPSSAMTGALEIPKATSPGVWPHSGQAARSCSVFPWSVIHTAPRMILQRAYWVLKPSGRPCSSR